MIDDNVLNKTTSKQHIAVLATRPIRCVNTPANALHQFKFIRVCNSFILSPFVRRTQPNRKLKNTQNVSVRFRMRWQRFHFTFRFLRSNPVASHRFNECSECWFCFRKSPTEFEEPFMVQAMAKFHEMAKFHVQNFFGFFVSIFHRNSIKNMVKNVNTQRMDVTTWKHDVLFTN